MGGAVSGAPVGPARLRETGPPAPELMHDRVRELQPLLGVLVEHVDAELARAGQLLAAAAAAGRGETFEHDGTLYTRVWTRHDDNMLQMGVSTVRVSAVGGRPVNLVAAEEVRQAVAADQGDDVAPGPGHGPPQRRRGVSGEVPDLAQPVSRCSRRSSCRRGIDTG